MPPPTIAVTAAIGARERAVRRTTSQPAVGTGRDHAGGWDDYSRIRSDPGSTESRTKREVGESTSRHSACLALQPGSPIPGAWGGVGSERKPTPPFGGPRPGYRSRRPP